MELVYLNSFSKDLDKLKDKNAKSILLSMITTLKNAPNLNGIPNVKKIKGVKNFYRIRVGDYRLGIEHQDNKLVLIRFLSRKDIYKYFP